MGKKKQKQSRATLVQILQEWVFSDDDAYGRGSIGRLFGTTPEVAALAAESYVLLKTLLALADEGSVEQVDYGPIVEKPGLYQELFNAALLSEAVERATSIDESRKLVHLGGGGSDMRRNSRIVSGFLLELLCHSVAPAFPDWKAAEIAMMDFYEPFDRVYRAGIPPHELVMSMCREMLPSGPVEMLNTLCERFDTGGARSRFGTAFLSGVTLSGHFHSLICEDLLTPGPGVFLRFLSRLEDVAIEAMQEFWCHGTRVIARTVRGKGKHHISDCPQAQDLLALAALVVTAEAGERTASAGLLMVNLPEYLPQLAVMSMYVGLEWAIRRKEETAAVQLQKDLASMALGEMSAHPDVYRLASLPLALCNRELAEAVLALEGAIMWREHRKR